MMSLPRRALLLTAASAAGPPFALAAPQAIVVCPLAAAPTVVVPGVSDAFATRFVGGKIYRGLMRWGPGGTLEPDLASTAGISADGLTYVFRLRPGVTWHDSGGFDAEDVVFSLARFHRALQPRLRLQRVHVDAPDPQTVVLHLSAPGDLSLRQLDALTLPIVPQHVHDRPGWGLDPQEVTPVGAGPFRMDGWLRLVRFEWYAGPKAGIDAIDCPIVPDPAARPDVAGSGQALLLAGDAVDLSAVPRLRALPGLVAEADYPPADRSIAGLRLNVAAKPLDQAEVRLALACAIDREAVLREAWAGLGRVATGPLLAGSSGRDAATALPGASAQAAAGHLNTAGLRPDDRGIRASLTYLHPPGAPWQALFSVVRAALGQIGITVTAEGVTAEAWAVRVAAGDYQLTGFEDPQTGDPAADLARYANLVPDLLPLLAGQDPKLADAQALLVARMPMLWLVEPGCPVVRDKRLQIDGGVLGSFAGISL